MAIVEAITSRNRGMAAVLIMCIADGYFLARLTTASTFVAFSVRIVDCRANRRDQRVRR